MSTEICRHIRVNGTRCGSPAISGRSFCYFHIHIARRHRSVTQRSTQQEAIPTVIHPLNSDGDRQREPLVAEYFVPSRGALTLDLPPLEDCESIQMALSMLITAMAQNRIDPKRATPLLYGLQVASVHARSLPREPTSLASFVRQTVTDDEGQELAPDEDPVPLSPGLTRGRIIAELLRKLEQQEREQQQRKVAKATKAASSE
jgi:hypothetical protein